MTKTDKKKLNPNDDEMHDLEDRGLLVSICMIVKNEEANLKRCLDSLLPILHEPWCELIITDTGSTDRTVEVAKTYTDKVFEKKFEPWSFSDARNFTIKHAKGRRIFTIDADHELPQACLYLLEELIWDEKNDNTSIFLMIRNILTADNKQYTEMLQPLLFMNDNKDIYSERIHNKPRTEPPFIFAEHVWLNHYGYKFLQKPELFKKKNDRSLPMLKEEYKKNPDNLHILTHLTKQVFVGHDFEATKKYGELWLKKFSKVDYHTGWMSYMEVFIDLVTAYVLTKDIKNALRVMKKTEKYSTRLFGIYHNIAQYYVETKEHDKAAEMFEKCREIATTPGDPYEKLCSNFTKMAFPGVLRWLAIHNFRRKQYAKAGAYLNQAITANDGRIEFPWDIWNDDEAKKLLK